MYGADVKSLYDEAVNPRASIDMKKSTLVYVNLPSDEVARQIQSRSIMIKEILDVYSQSKGSYEDLITNMDVPRLSANITPGAKFKFFLEGIGVKINLAKQVEIINMFKCFPFD